MDQPLDSASHWRRAVLVGLLLVWGVVALYYGSGTARQEGPLEELAPGQVLAAVEPLNGATGQQQLTDGAAALGSVADVGLKGADAAVGDSESEASVSAVLSSDRCRNFSEAAFRAAVKRENRRYLFMEPMRVGYGLTNQLITYAALIFFAMEDNRVVVFPPARAPFHTLVNLERSRLSPMFNYSADGFPHVDTTLPSDG
jgi:hypothetical protein